MFTLCMISGTVSIMHAWLKTVVICFAYFVGKSLWSILILIMSHCANMWFRCAKRLRYSQIAWLLKLVLICASRHGYGRWQAILDDKDLRIQDIVCQELNLPVINLAELGGGQSQSESHPTRSEPPGDPLKGIGSENGPGAVPAGGVTDANNLLYQFREIQRRQVEFVKKRVLLLEKGLNAEYQKECFVSSSVYLTISLVFGQ